MQINDNFYMKLAIDEAWKYQLLTYPNPAVGCVVVKNGEILSIEAHKEAGLPHAELSALKQAFLKKFPNDTLKAINDPFKIEEYLILHHNNFFRDCTIYVTLEPCNHIGKTPSCAILIKKLKPKRVVISQLDTNKKASGGMQTLQSVGIEVVSGVLEKEGYELLYPFIKWSKGTFIFYKMAQTLNGSIDGQISSNQAKAYVHALRDKIELLAIGGNTVRTDRPTLDARFVAGKSPNILIFSKSKEFDKTIPLFKVPNREVIITDDLFTLLDYKFVMVEGVYSLMQTLKERIDYFVLIINPKIRNGLNAFSDIDIDFEIVHENFVGEEKVVYLRKK